MVAPSALVFVLDKINCSRHRVGVRRTSGVSLDGAFGVLLRPRPVDVSMTTAIGPGFFVWTLDRICESAVASAERPAARAGQISVPRAREAPRAEAGIRPPALRFVNVNVMTVAEKWLSARSWLCHKHGSCAECGFRRVYGG